MKKEKELKEEINRLENKSWFRCDVKYTKEQWFKLTTQLKTLQERNTEVKQAMTNFENKLRDNHFIMNEELLKELLQKLGLEDLK